MKKYRLLNKYGNRVIYTDSEREKNGLLKRGFHIDKQIIPKNVQAENTKTEQPKTRRKAVNKNEGKVKD